MKRFLFLTPPSSPPEEDGWVKLGRGHWKSGAQKMKYEPRDSAGKALLSAFLGTLAIFGSTWLALFAWCYGITAYAHWLVGN